MLLWGTVGFSISLVLRNPIYYFLVLLSFNDVTLSTTTMSNMLCLFWFNLKKIVFKA